MASQPFALYIRGPRTEIFELAGALGFESEMEALAVSIFEDNPDKDIFNLQALYETAAEAESVLNDLNLETALEAFVTRLPNEDWVAISQKGLPPVEAGSFWIYGAHDKHLIPENCPYPIHIEAGAAFGTGHHGTTKGCLLIFDDLLKSGFNPAKILDLGCGAGTLAIAAAMTLNKSIQASDIDPQAVAVTIANARQNNVAQHLTAFQADGFESPSLSGQTFDLIFANILAGPLMALAPDISGALEIGGRVILSGILDEQAEKVSTVFEANDINIKKGPSLSGWTSLKGEKR